MYDLSFVIHRFYLKRFSLLLSPPPLPCTVSFAQTFFFPATVSSTTFITHFRSHLTTFQTLCHLPSHRRIEAGKNTSAGARKRERKSPGAFESSGCTSTSYRRTECSPRIKCRMTNAAPRAGNPTEVSRL